ncbi:MAG: SpoIIE family protein phosphatase [Bacteroidales bacterium]|nr:SpoIIE family protein phosphatase [Bacteroidales bacterium]
MGINKLDIKKKKFNLYKKCKQLPVADNDVTAILYVNPNSIYTGTRNNGISLINRNNNSVKIFNKKNNNLPNDNIYCFYKTSTEKLIAGTDKGIYIFDGYQWSASDKCVGYENCAALQNKRITTIIEDSKHNFWFGTNQGLYKLTADKKLIEFYHDYNNKTTLSSNQINILFEDSKGNIWIGTNSGLNRYIKDIDIFERRYYENNSNLGLSHNTVYAIAEDEEGYLWIGTGAGLDKFDPSNGIFSYINEKDGLPNNQIYSIIKSQTNLWVSTNKGIAMLSLKDTIIKSFDIVDGLQGFEFNQNSATISPMGEIFFGGIDGMNSFFPDSIKNNPTIPQIIITALKVYSNNVKSIFHLDGKDEIILSYNNRNFTIEFSALEFTQPTQNSYEYFMQGLDKDWIQIGNRNFANFSNIPSGTYVFKVRGSNNDQVWNTVGTELKITIQTPIWKNAWSILAYIVIIALLIYTYIEYRTKKLRTANKLLIDKQEAALEIAHQKEELAIKNKNILDSITYAKRIQWAIMPSRAKFKYLIPSSFILYKPKDIVSGDFYWITEIEDKIFIAAVDCTGHGVPGAFMSIIGYDLLRNITKERKIHKPSEVLDYLNKALIELLTKNVMEDDEVKDGMDIALCVFHKKKGIIEFAGAFNPLYLIRNNKIMTIKGDRFSVGLGNEHIEETFKNNILKLQKDDKLYIFSDGYADQFGGPSAKKMKYRRFRHLLLSIHNLPFPNQMEYLEQHFQTWKGQLEQIDDILILGMNFDKYLEEIDITNNLSDIS